MDFSQRILSLSWRFYQYCVNWRGWFIFRSLILSISNYYVIMWDGFSLVFKIWSCSSLFMINPERKKIERNYLTTISKDLISFELSAETQLPIHLHDMKIHQSMSIDYHYFHFFLLASHLHLSSSGTPSSFHPFTSFHHLKWYQISLNSETFWNDWYSSEIQRKINTSGWSNYQNKFSIQTDWFEILNQSWINLICCPNLLNW